MRRLALVQLAFALGILFVVLSVYGAWYVIVGKTSAEAAALAEQIRIKGEDSARIKAAQEALESLGEDEAAVRAYLVREADIVPFLGGLERTGTTLGSTVEVVSVGAETGTPPAIALSLKITGSFDAVMRTLGVIEYGPYESRVVSMTLDTVTNESGAAVWTAATTFRIGTQAATP